MKHSLLYPMLLDHEGEFRSGQLPKSDVPEEEKEAPSPTKSTSSSNIRLSLSKQLGYRQKPIQQVTRNRDY